MDIRETFARMAMNDEETVALIAGGHTFGKSSRRRRRGKTTSGPSPRARSDRGAGLRLEEQPVGTGNGSDTITGGPEGAWTTTRHSGTTTSSTTLFGYEWELTKSPAGAAAVDSEGRPRPPAPRRTRTIRRRRQHPVFMLTTDLSLREDPIYEPISRRFHENPDEFADAFARAWYKLTHRDMGPLSALSRQPEVPAEPQLWQDPVPAVDHELIGDRTIAEP